MFWYSNSFFFPLDFSLVGIFFGFFCEQGLARWGFYLAFQQVCYLALSFWLDKEESSPIPKSRFFSFIGLLLIQVSFGYFHFGDNYLSDPLRLAALLSGASIVFLSLAKRARRAFQLTFLISFLVSVFIGVMSSPDYKATIWGIPNGIIIFGLIHIWPFFGLLLFKDSLPRRKQPFVPLFFGGVFFLLGYFPELSWLEKWIEGVDLLFLILGFISFVEDERSYQRRITTITKRWTNSRKKDRTRSRKRSVRRIHGDGVERIGRH